MTRLNPRYLVFVLPGLMLVMGGIGYWWFRLDSPTRDTLDAWVIDPSSRPDLKTTLTKPCPGAPFLLPSSGFMGFLYADHTPPYNPFGPHPGVDIFGDGAPGTIPI